MLKSEAKDLYGQIEKLTQEIRAKKVICMKAIIQYKSYLFGLGQSIDKIYFDTLGHFSSLKEAELKSGCKVRAGPKTNDITPLLDYTIKIGNDRYTGELRGPYASGKTCVVGEHHIKQTICIAKDKYDNYVIDIGMVNDKLYMIQFNPYKLDYDQAMDIGHQVICYYNRCNI